MHIATKRFELEIHRDSLWLRLTLFGRTFDTFSDFAGRGLSATSWTKDVRPSLAGELDA
ncbi:hypothetical protein G6L94_16610 [Agrobacterium rhizogenes]|uniref:hypothetical protein n=1 Tax=Rhizobium rhizogenes TaxID=359 RepID=UPI00130171C1|nr:hypothetical protein [Rhizobium rhizogenes]NTH13567.1 hypothetical protein [Rhizobium rhizogenes]NTI49944.1 hypothetical protein [Rhizobium rhizogenes]NTI95315.1 hypothetical protein [Rhizobium rhizogenes]NTJ57783.1 hypothetical protein [Rhizobium rhizogenes]